MQRRKRRRRLTEMRAIISDSVSSLRTVKLKNILNFRIKEKFQ